MKRLAAIISAIALGIALACAGTPQSQCQDGSVKVQVNGDKRTVYHCENGEWVKQ